jgi:hypothetical protein
VRKCCAGILKDNEVTKRIKYNKSRTGEKRKHYINEDDVEVVLSRLPKELWTRLRAVHFNDRSWGCRKLGYVIAICALPPRVSLSRYLIRRSPKEFGAIRGQQWPEIAVRRFLLYDVFLHELGHLQIVDPEAKRLRRKFASETKAQEFADYWRAKLWLTNFDHTDQVHNPPSVEEMRQLEKVVAKYPAKAEQAVSKAAAWGSNPRARAGTKNADVAD